MTVDSVSIRFIALLAIILYPGIMTYATGVIYDGLWMNDKWDVQGTVKYMVNGVALYTYTGEWLCGKKHGQGCWEEEGHKYTGMWSNDNLRGTGKDNVNIGK